LPLQDWGARSEGVCVRTRLSDAPGLNRALLTGYLAHRDHPQTCRSHYFAGRFENVYIPESLIPALSRLLGVVRPVVSEAIGIAAAMRQGVWFNAMSPGQRTTLHSHDGYDEWISAVYYVRVPSRSGDLVLHPPEGKVALAPREGDLLLFDPGVPHEVGEHLGRGLRLSVAMNFGPAGD
jgi:hypothetical protein